MSHRDWIQASYPYMATQYWPSVRGRALRAIKTMHPRWVTTLRNGYEDKLQRKPRPKQ